jgi:MFS transporter, PAT family, beta-lactamase induction signal transducer AmpG
MRDWLMVYGNRRVLSLVGLGFSSGLPLALIGTTLQAWMTTENVDLRVIGIFSLVGLPYTLKVFWAPIMDRFTPPWLGRRRGWIIIIQLLLAVSILALGLTSPSIKPWVVASLALTIAFCSASQDIVIDAYRADVLQQKELGAGAATTVVGYRLAILTSGAIALIVSDYLPWRIIYLIMAAIMLINTLFTLTAPEPAERVIPPKTLKEAVLEPLLGYFNRSGAVEMLLFIMVYKLSDAMAGAMTTPFLLDMGFSRTDVGTVNKAFGLVSTILGTLVGGSVIAKIGINRSLWIFAFLQALPHLAFTGLALIGKDYVTMVAAIGLENIFGGMGTAAFVAFMMRLCDKRFTATQYALLTSFMAVTRVLAGVPTGFMVNSMGWPMFFAVSMLGALPGILLLPRFAPWRSRE